jgi:Osmosensitive K+ channel His kinase sensor domain
MHLDLRRMISFPSFAGSSLVSSRSTSAPVPAWGKTYQMLLEGNRLKRQDVDVVVGYVEPHDRPETIAQLGDLEVVPPLG